MTPGEWIASVSTAAGTGLAAFILAWRKRDDTPHAPRATDPGLEPRVAVLEQKSATLEPRVATLEASRQADAEAAEEKAKRAARHSAAKELRALIKAAAGRKEEDARDTDPPTDP